MSNAAFSPVEREAVYRAIAERRDVRSGFLPHPVPQETLLRLLAAAHCGPSVGLMQPTRFIVIRDVGVKRAVHGIFDQENARAAASYPDQRREQYGALKLGGILEAPMNICVVCDQQSDRGHGLGRQTMPETAVYSTVCGIQNLWLAARAEGIGVGWVSILDPVRLREVLGIPPHVLPVAYLCVGYVEVFGQLPELERLGWEQRTPLDHAICHDRFCEG